MYLKYFIKTILLVTLLNLIYGCNNESESDLEKYLGSYIVSDYCSFGEASYYISITVKNEQTNEIYIDNFGGYESKIVAIINQDNIVIDTYADNLHIVGIGIINPDRSQIDFNYTVSNNSISDSCSAVALK